MMVKNLKRMGLFVYEVKFKERNIFAQKFSTCVITNDHLKKERNLLGNYSYLT